ncbi:MAG: ribonuclease Y [Clostridia bacterium]
MSNLANVLAVAPVISVLIGIGALIIGAVCGGLIFRFVTQSKNGKNSIAAAKILEDAYAEAKTAKKEAILEAKEEVHKLRVECDKELSLRRSEMQRSEDRVTQKEEFIDKKELNLDKKQEENNDFKRQLDEKYVEVSKLIDEQSLIKGKMLTELEKVASMRKEDAKNMLITQITEEARKTAIKTVREIENNAVEDGIKKAQNIVALAIQKCATDMTSEMTVSVVSIPNDEMKGRIIGREGRNIRALESATGVDLIIDDTPEAITVSCFDPVRREIARLSLEKLILDGRIHPTRIEEIVEKVKKDVEQTIKEAGEKAVEEASVYGLNSEIVKTMGRLKFRTSYGQNCLKHSLETCHIAGLLAAELGADIKIAKRGGLLHDIGKALDHDQEGTHIELGVELAKKYKESHEVIHCIQAHHGGVEYESVEAILVQVADAISSSRPGARRENVETYVKRLEKLEEIANSFKGVEKSFAIQAGREIRIIVKPEELSEDDASLLAKDIAQKVENEMQYPGQIKINVIRETRFTETAK